MVSCDFFLLRLCSNLCYPSLLAICMAQEQVCTESHVNNALAQPHWRTLKALLKQKVKEVKKDNYNPIFKALKNLIKVLPM
jgi:hypothetical protein